jgi:multicomponent Na+:H+ antiporter subunit D
VHGTARLLLPVLVAAPILAACLLVAVGTVLPRRVVDTLATATALGVTGMAALLLVLTDPGRTIAWFGGWQPTHKVSVGIPFVADSVGAGLALMIGGLTTCALVYAWHYFDKGGSHFHALMLFFLAGMEGFVLSGDLFDMFVFFEVMGAAAYALTGIKVEDETAVEGGLNFGIVNSLGAYLSLAGIGILYARVGQLGLPQLGDALSHKPPDALVVGSFVLIATGFLVKAAVVPFHFWLADAHAVAPAPVCVLFSGAMVELGLYGVTRVYWVVYSETIPYYDIRRALLVAGVVTAVLGALMCFGQRHLKRLLAFSTIAHVGLFAMGLSALSSDGTGGAELYVLGHAGVKSALFLVAGVLLGTYGSVDEHELYGRARGQRLLAVLFFAAALGLAGLPPFGTALGKAISEDALITAGFPWGPAVFVLVSAVTGGAVLRVGLRVFAGLGPEPEREETSSGEETHGDEQRETERLGRTPVTMLAAIVVLILGGLAVGVVPHGGEAVAHAAERFMDGADYADQALQHSLPSTRLAPEPKATWSSLGVALGVLSTLLALGFAALGLWPERLRLLVGPVQAVMMRLRGLHTGHVGDYVAWLFAGVAALAALVGLPLL